VINDCYDHYAAIYFLLQDRLKSSTSSRSSSLSPNRSQPGQTQFHSDNHSSRRRPSTIAEQGVHQQVHVESLLSLRESTNGEPVQFNTEPTSNHPISTDEKGCQMLAGIRMTNYTCLTCTGPILENTSSTTTCVRCARLRVRRRNFAHQTPEQSNQDQVQAVHNHLLQAEDAVLRIEERNINVNIRHDSKDSGVSSQDYGECTPTTEKNLMFPRVPLPPTTERSSNIMSQLVRKLSEVEGPAKGQGTKVSVDEGVSIDTEEGSEAARSDPKKALSFDTSNLYGPQKMVLSRESMRFVNLYSITFN